MRQANKPVRDDHADRQATLALRVLLGETAPATAAPQADWNALTGLAERNAVLLRLADRFSDARQELPAFVQQAVAKERARVRAVLHLIGQVHDNCRRHGIAHLFPKALQHVPDMGHDVDLLAFAESTAVDRLILHDVPAVADPRDFGARLAGEASYTIAGTGLTVDIQHGRVGAPGSDRRLPPILRQSRRVIAFAGMALEAPSEEHQLILQGLQKVYRGTAFRLADVLFTIAAVRGGRLDWDEIQRTARRVNASAALSCYLAYIDQIHHQVFGDLLLPTDARRHLRLDGWGKVEFRCGLYGFPHRRVHRRLHLTLLGSAVVSGNWRAACGMGLLLVAATPARLRRLARWTSTAPTHGVG